MTMAANASGQDLHISKFLESNDKAYTEGVKQVVIRGDKLKPYNLSYYISYTILDKNTNPSLSSTIASAVKADGKTANDRKEVMLGGKLYYAIYTLPQIKNKSNRYIFYKDTSLKGNGRQVIVVYMEGQASLSEIKRKFNIN